MPICQLPSKVSRRSCDKVVHLKSGQSGQLPGPAVEGQGRFTKCWLPRGGGGGGGGGGEILPVV